MNAEAEIDIHAQGGGDGAGAEGAPAQGVAGPLVWLCAYEAVGEVEIRICADEATAYREIARICRTTWETARRVDSRRPEGIERPPLPPEPPREDREAVARYFAVMGEVFHSYTITLHTLIGGQAR
jgi:hypothetical protein